MFKKIILSYVIALGVLGVYFISAIILVSILPYIFPFLWKWTGLEIALLSISIPLVITVFIIKLFWYKIKKGYSGVYTCSFLLACSTFLLIFLAKEEPTYIKLSNDFNYLNNPYSSESLIFDDYAYKGNGIFYGSFYDELVILPKIEKYKEDKNYIIVHQVFDIDQIVSLLSVRMSLEDVFENKSSLNWYKKPIFYDTIFQLKISSLLKNNVGSIKEELVNTIKSAPYFIKMKQNKDNYYIISKKDKMIYGPSSKKDFEIKKDSLQVDLEFN